MVHTCEKECILEVMGGGCLAGKIRKKGGVFIFSLIKIYG